MYQSKSHIRTRIATAFLVLGIVLEGIWFIVAFGFNGFPLVALPLVGSWALVALSLVIFQRKPLGTVAAALLYIAVSVATFYEGGADLQHPSRFLHQHFVELMIVAAALLGFHRESEDALYRYR
jgi:hypothetical protein